MSTLPPKRTSFRIAMGVGLLIAVSAVIYVVIDARRSEARRHLEELQGELAWLLKKQEIEKLVSKPVTATAADALERDRKKAEDET